MTDKPTIYEALSRVMAAVQAVKKADRNQEQNYNFRGIDAVVNAVGPALREHGVLVTPELMEVGYRDVQTSRGKPSRECTVRVRYRFHGPAGDHLDVVVPGESMDFGDKGAAKAMSVAFRIALLQALAIPTDEPEHDPDASSYERAERPAGPTPEQARQNILANARAAIAAAPWGGLPAIEDRIVQYVERGSINPDDTLGLRQAIEARRAELERNRAASLPVEDRTAEQPDDACPKCGRLHFPWCEPHNRPADQPAMDADWPEPARPGNPT